jgi:hypothetical protein
LLQLEGANFMLVFSGFGVWWRGPASLSSQILEWWTIPFFLWLWHFFSADQWQFYNKRTPLSIWGLLLHVCILAPGGGRGWLATRL